MRNRETITRPDKILEERLLLLVLMLTATIISIGFLFAYPTYLRPIILFIFIFSILSIFLAITILQSSETAILYGGLANEILKNRKTCYIIVNTAGKVVLQNELAQNLLAETPILSFIEKHLVNNEVNRLKLKQLQSSAQHLKANTEELSLRINSSAVFSGDEWYRISLRPISLQPKDDMDSLTNRDRKYNIYLLWSIENISSEKTMETIFQEERRAFYNFLNFMPIGLYLLNSKGKIEYINKTLCLILNKREEELLGKDINTFLPHNLTGEERLHNACTQYISYIKTSGKTKEYLVRIDTFKEGEDIQTRGAVIGDIPTNDTLKQNYERAVSEVNSIFNLSPFGMMILDLDLIIKRANLRFMDILNISSASQLQDNYLTNYFDEESIAKIQ